MPSLWLGIPSAMGVRNQRQRFRCKACRKTLNAFSKTPLARLRHSEAWPKYLEGMTHSLTLRPAAKQCGISLQTSFRWRHRFLQVIEHDQAPELSGITEWDETFFRESFKGQKRNFRAKENQPLIFTAGRFGGWQPSLTVILTDSALRI